MRFYSLISLFVIFFTTPLMAQDDYTIILKVVDGKLENISKNKGLKKDSTYSVKIEGVNTAHHLFKLETKNFEIFSAAPAILSGIIPNINSSLSATRTTANNYFDFKTYMEDLRVVGAQADILYEKTKDKPSKTKADNALKEIKKKLDSLDNIIKSDLDYINEVQKRISLVRSFYITQDALLKNQFEYSDTLVSDFALAKSWNDELDNKNYLKKINYIIASKKADSTLTFENKFKSKKDLTELEYTLINTYSNDTIIQGKESFYNYGGWGLSFSTGFFYTNGLSDPAYYLKAKENGDLNILKEKEPGADVSVGAFAHVYYKASPTIRIGPGIGLAVSPFDGKSRYLFGGGLLIGKEKMVAVTGGVALAKSNEISKVAKLDENGPYLPAGSTTVPTYEDNNTSFFLGLSYNLFSTRK